MLGEFNFSPKQILNTKVVFDTTIVGKETIMGNRADYVEKREIDRSTLCSFDGPFELLHVDVGNLEFLGKNDTFLQYLLVIVDLYSSKVYTYSMRSRNQILQK